MENIETNENLNEGLILFFDLESDILDNHIDESNKKYIQDLIGRILKKYESEHETRIGFVGNIEMMVKWLSFLLTTAQYHKEDSLILGS